MPICSLWVKKWRQSVADNPCEDFRWVNFISCQQWAFMVEKKFILVKANACLSCENSQWFLVRYQVPWDSKLIIFYQTCRIEFLNGTANFGLSKILKVRNIRINLKEAIAHNSVFTFCINFLFFLYIFVLDLFSTKLILYYVLWLNMHIINFIILSNFHQIVVLHHLQSS